MLLRLLRPATLLALALWLAAPAGAQTADASVVPDDAPTWLSMADAIARAQADDKLIAIHNYAAWCGWCARMDQEVYTDDAVQAYLAEHYTATRVDIESETVVPFFDHEVSMAGLATAFGVSGTPTTVFVDADGELITKMPGYASPETFLAALRYVNEGAWETMAFTAYQELLRGTPAIDAAPPATAEPAPPQETQHDVSIDDPMIEDITIEVAPAAPSE